MSVQSQQSQQATWMVRGVPAPASALASAKVWDEQEPDGQEAV